LLSGLDEDAVDMLMDLAGPDTTCPLNFIELRHLGGALGRPPRIANAVGHRSAAFQLYSAGPLTMVESVRDYAALLAGRMAPWSTGQTSLNFIGAGGMETDTVRAAFTEDDYRRLMKVKRSYDPENLFRGNHNIPPARRIEATEHELFGR
jgi:FAD/FMN-containing dehydrogenase